MTPPDTNASTWFDFADHFWKYGGKKIRLRVIPVVRKNLQSNPNGVYVNCTSSGNKGEKQLSPFFLGPCELYGSLTAKKMENAWQFIFTPAMEAYIADHVWGLEEIVKLLD